MSQTSVMVGPRSLLRAVLRRIPATITLVLLMIVVGVATSALWQPFVNNSAWDVVAYGLPALEAGKWWTPLLGTFLIARPLLYIPGLLAFAGMGYLEYRRGSRIALAYFTVGQLFAVIGSALLVWILAFTPSDWAQNVATLRDVGPSGGTMACIAAAIGLFISPWRVRAWIVLLAFVFTTMLFWGNLDDIEHLLAVVLVLSVDRTLRVQKTTVREQRLLAFVGLTTLVIMEIIVLLVPTSGPFGATSPERNSIIDVATDVLIVIFVANGLRRGRRWAWIVSIVLASINVATFVVVITLVAVLGMSAVADLLSSPPSLSLATGVLWMLMLGYLFWVRGAFRARRSASVGIAPTPTKSDVVAALHESGGGTLSWMTTWDGNSYARTSTGIVVYQRRAGVAVALGDPLGPEDGRAQSVLEFIAASERAGLVPCFFSSSEETRAAVPKSWRSLIVADDTIVDLKGLEFTGKRWAAVRTSLNRAQREEVTFRMTRLTDEPWGVRQQLRAISEMWVGDKGLPEMGFTLGTLVEAEDPEVRLALAISSEGDVDGFLSWLPVYGHDGKIRGWTLDLMRRRDGGFAPVMEFLIGSSAAYFSREGAEVLSLSGAPLAHDYPEDAGVISDLSTRLAETLEPVYGFKSLHRFKEKFHPRYETMYLLFRDESDMSRIGMGLTRAFLPTATLRQFAGAGVELLRGGSS
ncbi:lysylphosphatidylglycerol synthetase-like protein (DUF2156 family) [Microbacterium endophyticum]|uniref:Lysylphosphatidylglycerol synthetase-like protein (DUF2156 family) n=1 Tax=Microbacterium endophyticum TaxID=1526412 RepID=A0A7W4YNG3_9MICO|nr:DUF2156 domain-containing protein [Microbacterium endophyticum]MBB2976554.1 lysylphosphatidylglycerol synthetase-like protein (DUF2156 family) [Microbacterium endophyticum]NIK36000.1 lysylphosphatidylglycerol synthetase-like protein (DUF2156 family) [Microbacterium endophyticum]